MCFVSGVIDEEFVNLCVLQFFNGTSFESFSFDDPSSQEGPEAVQDLYAFFL